MRLPTYAEHRRFCEIDGWEDKDAKSRKKKGDHHRYVKEIPGRSPLWTRVSHGNGQYRSPNLWSHILREQLQVTEEQFWAAVEQGIAPARPSSEPQRPKGNPIPLSLVNSLRYVAGFSEHEIATMSRADAERAWADWQTSIDDPERS